MIEIIQAGRLLRSPYYLSTFDDGAEGLVTYNRYLMPRGYGHREAEYWRLINGVSMWDVSGQRQVQIKGPDAAALTQVLCTRDLSEQKINQGKYVAICDHHGTLINDPIALKIDDDCFWLSIANSDIWFWARCVAGERGMDVKVSEPDVSPMAIQGPKAEALVATLFGDWVRELKYFWFRDAELDGIPLKVSRSGWSKQGGFELYLLDGQKGDRLWQIVKEAGQEFEIGPGYPDPAERVESGLLNYGIDTDDRTNPFEVRMERFVDLHLPSEVIGIEALRRIKTQGVQRHQLGIILDCPREAGDHASWSEVELGGEMVGHVTHRSWSFRIDAMIGLALVSVNAKAGNEVIVRNGGSAVKGRFVDLPFDV